MPDYQALVKRLRANLDKYPGFVNLNAEAATAIETLLAQQKVLVAEVEAWRNYASLKQERDRELARGECGAEGLPCPSWTAVNDAKNALDAARAATDAAFPEGLPK